MATWDQTTPYMDQTTEYRRLTATKVLVGLHVVGLVAGTIVLSVAPSLTNPFTLHHSDAVERGWIWQFFTYGFTFASTYVNVVREQFWVILFFPLMMIMLYQFGSELEAQVGPRKFLIIFFSGQVYGGLLQCLYQYLSGMACPATGLLYPGVNAVIMTMGFLHPSRTVMFFFMLPMRLISANIVLVLMTVLSCVPLLRIGQAPIATIAAVAAAYLLYKLEPKLDRWLDRREEGQTRREAQKLAAIKGRVDALLEKISRDGMGSLTSSERAFLESASKKVGSERWK